jgi:hypothetical protein
MVYHLQPAGQAIPTIWLKDHELSFSSFADFKACCVSLGWDVPDVIILIIIGEAKTPWKHDISKKMQKAMD